MSDVVLISLYSVSDMINISLLKFDISLISIWYRIKNIKVLRQLEFHLLCLKTSNKNKVLKCVNLLLKERCIGITWHFDKLFC